MCQYTDDDEYPEYAPPERSDSPLFDDDHKVLSDHVDCYDPADPSDPLDPPRIMFGELVAIPNRAVNDELDRIYRSSGLYWLEAAFAAPSPITRDDINGLCKELMFCTKSAGQHADGRQYLLFVFHNGKAE